MIVKVFKIVSVLEVADPLRRRTTSLAGAEGHSMWHFWHAFRIADAEVS